MDNRVRSPKTGRMVIIGGQTYRDLIKEGFISKNGKVLKSSRLSASVRKSSRLSASARKKNGGRGKSSRNDCDKEGSGKARSIALDIYNHPKLKPNSRLYRIVWLPKINNNLFLSNYEFAEDMTVSLGFQCIVNATKDPYKTPLVYISVPIEDDFDMDYKTFAKNVNSCTKSLRVCLKKGPTVVHCVEGMNRSVACIISFALKYSGHQSSLDDWVRYIKCRKAKRGYGDRWYTLTNPAFKEHLIKLHG